MKTRVTFRVAPDLADQLRDLPNQTLFVEQALRDALREKCPLCGGTGRAECRTVRVSNFRAAALPPIRRREVAIQLKSLVGFARRAAATNVDLRPERGAMRFVVANGSQVLLEGTLGKTGTRIGATEEKELA